MDISIDELPPSLGKEYFFTLNSLCWCCQTHVPGIQVAIKPLLSTDSRRLCGWTGSSWLSSDWKKKNARGRSRWPRNNADTVCHDVIRKTKAHLQLSLMWDEKGYYKLASSKRKIRDNVGLLLNEGRDPGAKWCRKDHGSECLYLSVCWSDQPSGIPRLLESLEKGKLTLAGEGTDRKQHLNKLNIYNPMGSPWRHPQMLRELSDVTARILFVIFEKAVVIRTESQGLEGRKYQSYQWEGQKEGSGEL